MHKGYILFIIIIITLFSGCTSIRPLESARDSITELDRLNSEQEPRNSELEYLFESERETNGIIKRILDEKRSELEEYFKEERSGFTRERGALDRLYEIFGDESEIIEQLIAGYNEIRTYLEDKGVLAKDIDSGPDIIIIDSNS